MSDMTKLKSVFEIVLGVFLIVYLTAVGAGAIIGIVYWFPKEATEVLGQAKGPYDVDTWPGSMEQLLVCLAVLGGVAGSFLHAAQSLTTYLGNRQFRASWTAWYFMRPWLGGVLGGAMYFVIRAGLVTGVNNVSVHSVVALGLLGGWFSKTATDKLQEIFETVFKTDEDSKRKDKLSPAKVPVIDSIVPNPVPAEDAMLKIKGKKFASGATVYLGLVDTETSFVSDVLLDVNLGGLGAARPSGRKVAVVVKNPDGGTSNSMEVEFQ